MTEPLLKSINGLTWAIHSPSRLTLNGTTIHLIYNGVEWVLYSSEKLLPRRAPRGWRFHSRAEALEYLNTQIARVCEEAN